MVYGTVLAALLKRFQKDCEDSLKKPAEKEEEGLIVNETKETKNSIPMSLEILVQLIGDCLSQGGKYLQGRLAAFTAECTSLKNLKRRKRQDGARSPVYFDLDLRLKDLDNLRDMCQKDLKALFDVVFEIENLRKAKLSQNPSVMAANQDKTHSDFFTKLTELCGSTSGGQSVMDILRSMSMQKSNKDQMDPTVRTKKVFDFLNQHQKYIQTSLLPLLKENCMLMPIVVSVFLNEFDG